MGVLSVRAPLLALVLLAGCGHDFKLRVDSPREARLVVPEGPFSPRRELPIPFVAHFDRSGPYAPYPVVLEIPARTAERYGASGAVKLHGKLWVFSATELTKDMTVPLPIPEARVAALVKGEVAEITHYVYDPSVRRRQGNQLARIVLRTTPF